MIIGLPILVNDLLSLIQNSMKIFADDVEVWQKIEKVNDNNVLQADLQSLEFLHTVG